MLSKIRFKKDSLHFIFETYSSYNNFENSTCFTNVKFVAVIYNFIYAITIEFDKRFVYNCSSSIISNFDLISLVLKAILHYYYCCMF